MPPPTESDPAGSDVQRWTAKRKAAVVLELLKGKTTAAVTEELVRTKKSLGRTEGKVDPVR